MINYFILGYQGFSYFKEKFDKKKYPKTILRIIDNGNQKITGHQLYETKKNTKFNHCLDKLLKKGNSISVFASPSSFEVFTSIYSSFNTEIFSIGETTSEYIKSQGFDVITSKKQTFESLVNEILNNNYQL